MKKVKALLKGLLVVVVLFILGMVIWLYRANSISPKIEGITILDSISHKATITRDQNGIPHILAENEADMYRTLGFVHAQDRMWQMDFYKRIGSGRISEIIGPTGITIDHTMRIFALRSLSKEIYKNLDSATKQAIDAYSEGINDYIKTTKKQNERYSFEYSALFYEPELWHSTDTILVSKVLTLLLSPHWLHELQAEKLQRALSPEQFESIFSRPATGFSGVSQGVNWERWIHAASNAWVVSGDRTESGYPLLASDPHLGLSSPSIWYLVRMKHGDQELVGATIPGLPFLMVGHNGRVAWGVTTFHVDCSDIERFPAKEVSLFSSEETITYRPFSMRKTVRIRRTRDGVVISDSPFFKSEKNEVYVLKHAALVPDDSSLTAIYQFQYAENVTQFDKALNHWVGPGQTFLFADVNKSYQMVSAARMPVRDQEKNWVDVIPIASWPRSKANTEWVGNANNNPAEDGYPFDLGDHFDEGYRMNRMTDLLERTQSHNPASFEAMQLDDVSYMAKKVLPFLLGQMGYKQDPFLDMLAKWDHQMDRDKMEPLLFTTWYMFTNKKIFMDRLRATKGASWIVKSKYLLAALKQPQLWCEGHSSCHQTVENAFNKAVSFLKEKYGKDHKKWKWGMVHKANFSHPVFGRLPFYDEWRETVVESGGSKHSLNAGITTFKGRTPLANIHGPALRAIFDLSDLDQSKFMVSPGQSGHPASKFFKNNLSRWQYGNYFRISEKNISTSRMLELIPKAKKEE